MPLAVKLMFHTDESISALTNMHSSVIIKHILLHEVYFYVLTFCMAVSWEEERQVMEMQRLQNTKHLHLPPSK